MGIPPPPFEIGVLRPDQKRISNCVPRDSSAQTTNQRRKKDAIPPTDISPTERFPDQKFLNRLNTTVSFDLGLRTRYFTGYNHFLSNEQKYSRQRVYYEFIIPRQNEQIRNAGFVPLSHFLTLRMRKLDKTCSLPFVKNLIQLLRDRR